MMNDRRQSSMMSVNVNRGGVSSGVYGLAFVGAAIYNIQHATSFWAGTVGLLKAMVWPALLVYRLLGFMARQP